MTESSVPLQWRLKKAKYTLTGSCCRNCNDYFFPPTNFCKKCRRAGKIEEFHFSGVGEIISHTVIRTAPEGFEKNTPYTIALIKLDEGPVISGQVIGNIDKVDAGKKVRTVFRKVYEDGPGGIIHYGLKWEIVDS